MADEGVPYVWSGGGRFEADRFIRGVLDRLQASAWGLSAVVDLGPVGPLSEDDMAALAAAPSAAELVAARDALPWARHWWSPRCRARMEPEIAWPQGMADVAGGMVRTGGHHGRCELRPHSRATDHALDRGLLLPRWSTRWTAKLVGEPPLPGREVGRRPADTEPMIVSGTSVSVPEGLGTCEHGWRVLCVEGFGRLGLLDGWSHVHYGDGCVRAAQR